MSMKNRRGGLFLVVLMLLAALAVPGWSLGVVERASAAPLADAATVTLSSGAKVGAARERLSGTDRYAVAVQISRRAFPDPAAVKTVYLINGDTSVEGLAAGVLADGPVLPVKPGCTTVPSSVKGEITRLAPDRVVAIGTSSQVCSAALTEAAQGRATSRIASSASRSARVASIATRAFPSGASTVYLMKGAVTADSLTVGSLKDGPVLVTGSDGTSVSSYTTKAIADLGATRVVAIGGRGSVSDAALAAAANGRATSRVSGADRYATAAAVAKRAFPSSTSRVYLMRGDSDTHAAASGMLKDGPVLLAKGSCAKVPSSTGSFLRSRTPSTVSAIGSSSTLCDSTMVGASNAARGKVDCSVTRCVALTFDDGPGAYTPSILDTLRSNRVPATFFVVGRMVDGNPSTAAREHVEGHVLGNHTWNHPQLSLLSASAQASELSSTSTELASHGIPRPTILRPPYGDYNSTTRTLGYPLIIWDVDPRDWEAGTTVDQVRSRVVSNTRNGSIVLMHDIHGRTASALPGIISDLKAQGYTMVTVPELTSMKAGDVVYRRGTVYSLGTGIGSDMTVRTQDGRTLGLVLDEAGVPGIAPQLSIEELAADQ